MKRVKQNLCKFLGKAKKKEDVASKSSNQDSLQGKAYNIDAVEDGSSNENQEDIITGSVNPIKEEASGKEVVKKLTDENHKVCNREVVAERLCNKGVVEERVVNVIQKDFDGIELNVEGSVAENPVETVEWSVNEIQKGTVAEESFIEINEHQGIGGLYKDDGPERQKEFLQKLGLTSYYPDGISLQTALEKSTGKQDSMADLPWYFLTKMLMLDYRGRDNMISQKMKNNNIDSSRSQNERSENVLDRLFADLTEDQFPTNSRYSAPHPLDVLIVVFRCSSNFLRQILCEKMFMCKLSLPLVLPPFLDSETIFLLWSLRNIVSESEGPNQGICQTSAVKRPTSVVACLRLGEIARSKSKFLNEILSSHSHPTFYHRDCKNGLNNRFLSDGLIEVAWHLPSRKPETIDHLDKTVAFLNLRGDGISQETSRTFMCQVANVVMVMVEICTLGRDNIIDTLGNITSNGAELLLIITKQSNESITQKNKEDLKRCVEAVKSNLEKQNIILDFNGGKNIEDLKEETTTKLSNCLKGETLRRSFQSFEELANLLHVTVDENTPECSIGHKGALEVVQIALDGGKNKLKTKKLPLQCVPWQEWSKLNKEEHRREKTCGDELSGYMDKIYREKKNCRNEQIHMVMEPNLLFDTFLRYLLDSKGEERLYFLKWLKLYLDDISREILPSLQMECTRKWNKIRLYEAGKIEKEKLLDLQRELATLERNLADSSLGLEHFIREIAQAFEAFEDIEEIESEGVQKRISGLPRIMAELMLLGFPLELMDGDAANVPLSWIKAVLEQLRELIDEKRIFVLSVLGIQSSGKSTMLNTMFGLQFAVAAGRCTRGVYAQLVPLSNEYSNEKYDYILVVDTEGLRAPELGHEKLQHDNEIATLVIGLGDVTLVTIKGENTSEMEDVLQIVVHAFLKMKLVNKHLALQPSCFFIHQNVPAPDAAQKLRSGQQKFLETLDKVTKVAGKQEDAPEFTKFSQVIEFDINDNISYFSDLWRGDPPMAPANPGYSENVNKVKQTLLTDIMEKRTTNLNIRKFSTKLKDLWNGILDQNFVFSFKNNLEMEAYSSLDDKLSNILWSLKKAALEWQSEKENEIVSSEHEIEKLRSSLTSECYGHLAQRYTAAKLNLQDIFKTDEDQLIINQWRSRTFQKLDDCYHDCISRTTDAISSKLKVRQIQIVQKNDMQKYQANVMEEAKKVAENLLQRENGQNLSEESLKDNFNEKWEEWITKLPQNYQDNINIHDRVDKVLYHKFFQDHPVVKKALEDLQLEDVNIIRSNFDEAVEKFVSRKLYIDFLVNKKEITRDLMEKLFADIRGFVEETKCHGFRANYAQEIIEWTDDMIRTLTKSRLTINVEEEFRMSVLICTCQFASSEYSKKCRLDIASDGKYKMGRFGIHPFFEQELSTMFSSKLMPLLHKSQKRSLRKFPIKLDEHVIHQGNMEILDTQRYVERLVSEMYDDVELYVMKSENQEFRDEYVEEIIEMVKDRVDKDKLVSFKKNFKIQLAVYVCYFALPTFCEKHKRYTDNINPRKIFRRDYYGTYFQLFKNSYNRITNETALSLLLSERLSKAIENAVDKDMARELADDVRNNVAEIRNKPVFLQAVLLQLLEEDNFEDFYLYLQDTNACFEKWIMYYTDNYLFPEDGNNRYLEIASRMASSLISKVCKEISGLSPNISRETSAKEALQEWIKEFQKRVMDKVPIPLHDLLSLVDGYDILDLDSFTKNLEKNLRVSEKKIRGIFQKHTKEHLRNAHEDSVYKIMFQECKGCTEKCPFCSAPCTLNKKEHLKDGIKHLAKEHYPQACAGYRLIRNEKLAIENCSTNVASESVSFSIKETKGEFHPYKNYHDIFPDWKIDGDPSVEASPYWKWFLVNYESQLAERYKAERPDIPSCWSSITKVMAGNSAKKFTSSS